jgi:hypothetical protein
MAEPLPNFATLVLAESRPGVVTVTMNRPQAMNAMNTEMMADLRQCFAGFYVDPGPAQKALSPAPVNTRQRASPGST